MAQPCVERRWAVAKGRLFGCWAVTLLPCGLVMRDRAAVAGLGGIWGGHPGPAQSCSLCPVLPDGRLQGCTSVSWLDVSLALKIDLKSK